MEKYRVYLDYTFIGQLTLEELLATIHDHLYSKDNINVEISIEKVMS